MLLQPGSRPVPTCSDYVLVRKLGAGAFGEVWHAHGPGGFDVALKFIRLSEQVLALELRSLEAVKSIRHPNLVSLFGVWHTDNWLILAMELCDRSLQDLLAEAPNCGLPPKYLLSYMSDAAAGLDALNAKQVQHRDVKPANLLLLNSGVKVADFGLAKALEHTAASNTGTGTIHYMAPECFRGELAPQSDQYSLAVTYYHLRTGQLLFRGDQAQVMYGHLELEPDLAQLPLEERSVLARALAKEPSKRWPRCEMFASGLIAAQQQPREVPQPNRSLPQVHGGMPTYTPPPPATGLSDPERTSRSEFQGNSLDPRQSPPGSGPLLGKLAGTLLLFIVLLGITALWTRHGQQPEAQPKGPNKTALPVDATFVIQAPSVTTTLEQGHTKEVKLTLHRGKDFHDDVKFKFDAPAALIIDPGTRTVLSGDDNELAVRVIAAEDAQVGDQSIKATAVPKTGSATSIKFRVRVEKSETK